MLNDIIKRNAKCIRPMKNIMGRLELILLTVLKGNIRNRRKFWVVS